MKKFIMIFGVGVGVGEINLEPERIESLRIHVKQLREIEEQAFSFPELRNQIIETLDTYAEREENKPEAKFLARRIADKVAAISMLEILHGN